MVVKTDKDNKITGHVMTAIKNKHLAVDNTESYDILLEYFKMVKERLDEMQEDFSNSEFDTEVKKKALSKFSQFNKSVYYSVITDKFYIGQFKEVDKDQNLSGSSKYFYHTLDRILYVGDIKISNKLVDDEIVPGGDLGYYVKSEEDLVSHFQKKFTKILDNHKKVELEYLSEVPHNAVEKSFKTWLRFREDLNLSKEESKIFLEDYEHIENKVFLEDYEHIKQLSNEYIDIDSRIVFGHYLKLIRDSENLKEKPVNSYFPDLNYRVDSSFVDFATVVLVNKEQSLLLNYKIGGVVYPDDKVSVARTFEQEIQLAKLTGYSSVGEYTRTTTFRNKLKDISKKMTSFTNDFARLTIKNYCAENYK